MKAAIIASITTLALASGLFSIIAINDIQPVKQHEYTWTIKDFEIPEVEEPLTEEPKPVEESVEPIEPETENASSEEYYEDTSVESYTSYDGDFKSAGVIYGDDGTRYTWYSQNTLPGNGLTELNNNGRHVDDRGFVCDGDGYIAVASNDHPQGTIVDTPFGEGRVYDSGCDSGTIDIYTDF